MQIGSHEPPSIAFQLEISPSTFSCEGNAEPKPRIAVTATSYASEPVTICSFETLLNLSLSQYRHNFTCRDLETNDFVWMNEVKGPHRGPIRRSKNSRDDKYFVTLQPGVPYHVACEFYLAKRPLWQSEDCSRDKYLHLPTLHGTSTFLNYLESGHSYIFSVADTENIKWWWFGTRGDVLEPEGSSGSLLGLPPNGRPIPVKLDTDAIIHIS